MITQIVDIFKKQAREHKVIKAFHYGRTYDLGSGNEQHPLFWLEDPINGNYQTNLFQNSINFSILLLPDKDKTVDYLQNIAFSIGLNILERIKKDKDSLISIDSWNFTTLVHYYDNDAIGCRFSVVFTNRNLVNLCLINDQFDMDKTFESKEYFPEIDVPTSNHCVTFTDKLPVFDLKTTK